MKKRKPKGKPLPALAAAVDRAHRGHKPGKHPNTLTHKGKTYRLGKT